MMNQSAIGFDDAVQLLAADNGLSDIEAGTFVHMAITDGGVTIFVGGGQSFKWLDRPGRKSRRTTVVGSDFSVFEVGRGWSDLDAVAGLDDQSEPEADLNGSASDFGLDPSWSYDRIALARALQRLHPSLRVDGLTPVSEEPTTSKQTKTAKEIRKWVSQVIQEIVDAPGFSPVSEAKMLARVERRAESEGREFSGKAFEDAWKGLDPKHKLGGAPKTPSTEEKGGRSV